VCWKQKKKKKKKKKERKAVSLLNFVSDNPLEITCFRLILLPLLLLLGSLLSLFWPFIFKTNQSDQKKEKKKKRKKKEQTTRLSVGSMAVLFKEGVHSPPTDSFYKQSCNQCLTDGTDGVLEWCERDENEANLIVVDVKFTCVSHTEPRDEKEGERNEQSAEKHRQELVAEKQVKVESHQE
jgi:hypothetical protein